MTGRYVRVASTATTSRTSFSAQHANDDLKVFARKSIRYAASEKSKIAVEREALLLSSLNHPNVVKLHGIEWQSHKARLYMECCEEGSLQDMIERIKRSRRNLVL